MAPTSVEVRQASGTDPVRFSTAPHLPSEQKKAVLRRVEMELDEADEMVCDDSLGPYVVDGSTHAKPTWY